MRAWYADTAITAPYQLDGREATLEQQAQGAITGHSQGGPVSANERERIANFERSVFSSDRSRWVAFGVTKDVEEWQKLTPQEQRGRQVYKKVCESFTAAATRRRSWIAWFTARASRRSSPTAM